MPSWLTNKLWLEREIARELGIRRRVWFCTHHLVARGQRIFPSRYEEAAILTIDGVGEWSTATWGIGRGNKIELTEEMRFPELARIALFGVHVLLRLQGQQRRIQADGPGPRMASRHTPT